MSTITITISDSVKEYLDKYTREHNLDENAFIESCIAAGLIEEVDDPELAQAIMEGLESGDADESDVMAIMGRIK